MKKLTGIVISPLCSLTTHARSQSINALSLKLNKPLLGLVFSLVIIQSAYADYNCTGKVSSMQTSAGATVYVFSSELYGNEQGRAVCNLENVWKGVKLSTCRAWLAQILTAEATGLDLTVRYGDTLTCTTQPTYSGASGPVSLRVYQ